MEIYLKAALINRTYSHRDYCTDVHQKYFKRKKIKEGQQNVKNHNCHFPQIHSKRLLHYLLQIA